MLLEGFLLFASAFASNIKHVVVLGVDGLDAKRLETINAPNIKELKESGSYALARSVFPTVSYPNWYSILSGSEPSFHGIDSNEYERENPKVISVEGICKEMPNIFSVTRQFFPKEKLAAFYSWTTIKECIQPVELIDQDVYGEKDVDIMPKVLQALEKEQPKLLFVYLGSIDDAGHGYGFGKEYDNTVKQVDTWVGQILEKIDRSSSLVVIVTDHGRKHPIGAYHGSFTHTELTTLWVANGPGVKRNYSIQMPVMNVDTAPTVLDAFGIEPPIQMRSRAVKEIYEREKLSLGKPRRGSFGWRFDTPASANESQCLADFKLQEPMLYGNWDNASYGIGVLVGVVTTLLAVIGLALVGFLCCGAFRRVLKPSNRSTRIKMIK